MEAAPSQRYHLRYQTLLTGQKRQRLSEESL
jgi:hypothetical protein